MKLAQFYIAPRQIDCSIALNRDDFLVYISIWNFTFAWIYSVCSAVCLSLLKPASAKYAMNASSFKQKSEKLAEMGRRLVKKTWKLVISRCCFAEDGREMYQEL